MSHRRRAVARRAVDGRSDLAVPPLLMASGYLGAAVAPSGGRRIGRALALTLARLGYPLALPARRRDQLEMVRSEGETVSVEAFDADLLDHGLTNMARRTSGSRAEARARLQRVIPMGEILQLDEVAALLADLVSPAARHIRPRAP